MFPTFWYFNFFSILVIFRGGPVTKTPCTFELSGKIYNTPLDWGYGSLFWWPLVPICQIVLNPILRLRVSKEVSVSMWEQWRADKVFAGSRLIHAYCLCQCLAWVASVWWAGASIHLSGGAICRHDSRCVPGGGQEGRNMNILPSNKPTSSQTPQHTLLLKALVSGARSWTSGTAGVSAFGHSPSAYLSSGRGAARFWNNWPLYCFEYSQSPGGCGKTFR